jgi:hypothetical protein
MIVILNSDVLFTNSFVHRRVHASWRRFSEECRRVNAELIIPSTSLYEIELRQKELYDAEIRNITSAITLLKKYEVQFEPPAPQQLIAVPDIVQYFRETDVSIRVEEATLADFQDAERRAAMHLPPAPPRTQPTGKEDTDDSDEMRDLVIWAVSCRLAVQNGGAILVSRDKVHRGKLGHDEAVEKQLQIAFDFDEALGMLGAETEAGKIATQFLRQAWPHLRAKGLPFNEQFGVRTITDTAFVQGDVDIALAQFSFSCDTDKNRNFSSKVKVSDIQDDHFLLTISDACIDKRKFSAGNIEIPVTHQAKSSEGDFDERLNALKYMLR